MNELFGLLLLSEVRTIQRILLWIRLTEEPELSRDKMPAPTSLPLSQRISVQHTSTRKSCLQMRHTSMKPACMTSNPQLSPDPDLQGVSGEATKTYRSDPLHSELGFRVHVFHRLYLPGLIFLLQRVVAPDIHLRN